LLSLYLPLYLSLLHTHTLSSLTHSLWLLLRSLRAALIGELHHIPLEASQCVLRIRATGSLQILCERGKRQR
jgi:hypothetical protein